MQSFKKVYFGNKGTFQNAIHTFSEFFPEALQYHGKLSLITDFRLIYMFS